MYFSNKMNPRILKRFVIICGISTFVMFTVWMIVKSFMDRPPGDYETQICDQRLKDKLWDQAIDEANINKKEYQIAEKELTSLIEFLNKNLKDDDLTGKGTLAAAFANRGIIKDRKEQYEEALKDYIKALEIDHEAVAGPGLGHKIIYMINKPSSVRDRAQYIYEQLQLPLEKRVLRLPEVDEEQRMHKPGKL